MQFQYPTYLWALLAIALPIIIHLFYFKRFKKVYFTNLWLLREVKEETSMRNKLRDLLTLLMRILAIISLVIAFVQPIWNIDGEKVDLGKKSVGIYIDNSFSMQAKREAIMLIDIAKQKAIEIVNAYASNDEFNILSNDITPRQLRMISKEQAILEIEAITISPARKQLQTIRNKQIELMSSLNTSKRLYILSDFQENITNLSQIVDTTIQSYLLAIQDVREDNVTIDSIWLIAPLPMVNETNNLMIKIANRGHQEIQNLRLNLTQNNQSRPIATYDIPANKSIIDTIKIVLNNAGWQELEFNITDYPITFDDDYKVCFEVKDRIDVLNIYEGQSSIPLEAAYKGTNIVDYNAVSYLQVDYGNIKNQELVLLNNLNSISSGLVNILESYIKEGGNLFITPSEQINLKSYNHFMDVLKIDRFTAAKEENKLTSYINTSEFIFNNVFIKKYKNLKMPRTSLSYQLIGSSKNPRENIIKYRDGSPFITKYKYGNGNVYICVAPINEDYNSLAQNAEIFVPLVYKMSISTIAADKLSYTVAKDRILKVKGIGEDEHNILKIKATKDDFEFIPGQRVIESSMVLNVNDQIKLPGFYSLIRDNQQIAKWAYNYSREESKLNYLSMNQLKLKYQNTYQFLNDNLNNNLTNIIKEKNEGIALWKWALIMALIFLGLEILLLRLRRV